MIKVAIYARVSTAEQAEEGYSINAQINSVEEKCTKEGKVVVEKYIDAGISGKSMKNRPALQKLISDSKDGIFNEVYVWKTNRLARNHLELLTIVKMLEENNVCFRSCSEPFESSTASGKLMMNLLSSIGEFERTTIVDNVKMGMKQRARNGKWNGGIILGYRSVQDKSNSEKTKLEIVESEAYVIRRIFNLYAEGKGFKAIVNIVNKENLKTKKGNLFAISSIKEILMNPTYIGKIRYNVRENWSQNRRKTINKNPILCEGEHDAIISMDIWNKCQSIYRERSCKPSRVFGGSYLLTGLIKCPDCGASMVAGRVSKKRDNGEKYIIRYYQCSNWKNKGSSACKPNSIRAEIIEREVISRISKLCNSNKIINKMLGRISSKGILKINNLKERIKSLKEQENNITKRKQNIFKLYEEEIIDKDILKERIVDLQNELDNNLNMQIDIEKELMNTDCTSFDEKQVKMIIKNLNVVLDIADNEKKKLLLNSIINKICVDKEKNIEKLEIKINSKLKQYLGIKEEESDKDSSSFNFIIEI